eukprot:213128-Pleurochrysis_carterae.AAC.3
MPQIPVYGIPLFARRASHGRPLCGPQRAKHTLLRTGTPSLPFHLALTLSRSCAQIPSPRSISSRIPRLPPSRVSASQSARTPLSASSPISPPPSLPSFHASHPRSHAPTQA